MLCNAESWAGMWQEPHWTNSHGMYKFTLSSGTEMFSEPVIGFY
jgi:hypothetical protein